MTRELAIEAVIATDCDDPEPYLVYADWLQSRGEPRGTYIMLHDALRRDPHNGEAATAAAALFEDHRAALLGEMAQRNDVELDWYQGFVSAVRVRYFAWHQLRDALRAMVATPACAFVQRITIADATEADRVEALLLELKQPQTLCHLAIGTPSEWTITPALIDAFPRLARDPAIVWNEAIAAAMANQRLAPELDVDALPALALKPGMTYAAPHVIAVGLRAELDKKRPIGMLGALPRACTRESLDVYALALATQSDRVKWAFDALGLLGGDRCVAHLGDALRTFSPARVKHALGHLRRIGSNAAISELARLAGEGGRHANAAAEVLELVALDHDADSLTQLVARSCPRTGQRYVDLQRRWLEDIMCAGDQLRSDDFVMHVTTHPIRRALVGALVWTDDATRFRIAPDGELVTVDGAPHSLAPGAKVRVAHPIELEPAERAAWHACLGSQPFPQLERAVHRLDAGAGAQVRLERATGRISVRKLTSRLAARGWRDLDGTFVRRYRRDNAFAKVTVGSANLSVCFHRGSDWIDRPFGTLHAVTISELLSDLTV